MQNQKRSKKKGIQFENKVQKSINSGANWFSPLDLNSDKYCIECKYTDKKGYRISLDLVEKIWTQSLDNNKEPLLIIGLNRNDEQQFVIRCTFSVERKS